jgi:hypothetical protein
MTYPRDITKREWNELTSGKKLAYRRTLRQEAKHNLIPLSQRTPDKEGILKASDLKFNAELQRNHAYQRGHDAKRHAEMLELKQAHKRDATGPEITELYRLHSSAALAHVQAVHEWYKYVEAAAKIGQDCCQCYALTPIDQALEQANKHADRIHDVDLAASTLDRIEEAEVLRDKAHALLHPPKPSRAIVAYYVDHLENDYCFEALNWDLNPTTAGDLYRDCMKLFGRCVDSLWTKYGNRVIRNGWTFEKRILLKDGRSYLQKTQVLLRDGYDRPLDLDLVR